MSNLGRFRSYSSVKFPGGGVNSPVAILLRPNCVAGLTVKMIVGGVPLSRCCADCTGGQVWVHCGGRTRTCSSPFPRWTNAFGPCRPGCYCPQHIPIWHNGRCITWRQCSSKVDSYVGRWPWHILRYAEHYVRNH